MNSEIHHIDTNGQESEPINANPFTYLEKGQNGEVEEACPKSDTTDELDVKKLKRDISGLRKKLKIYRISFRDLLSCAPKNRDSIYMCIKAAKAIVENDWILEKIRKKKTLPIEDVLSVVNVYRGTLKKNSKYIIAICLIITGGLETLNRYISNTYAKKEQDSNLGVVLELARDGAVVMTGECRFLLVIKKKNMYLGQEVKFAEWEIRRYRRNTVRKAAAVVVLLGMAVLLPFFFSRGQIAYSDKGFALVAIDINPSLGLLVDRNDTVIDVNTINRDADILLMDNDLKGMPVEDAIEMIFEFAHDRGYVYEDKENLVLVSLALNPDADEKGDEEEKFEHLFNRIKSKVIGDEVIIPIVIAVPQDTVKSAEMNNLSIGRQYIYERLQGFDVGKVRRSSIEDLLIEYEYSVGL